MKRTGPWLLASALLLGAAAIAQGPTPPGKPATGISANSTGATSTGAGSTGATSATSTEAVSTDATSATSTGQTSTAATSATSDTAPPDQPGPVAGDDNGGEVSLVRKGKDGKERPLRVVRSSSDDTTGIFAICGPREDEPDTTPTEFIASDTSAGGVQVTVDKNLIQAPFAQITRQQGGDGHIEMSTGKADFLPDDKIDQQSPDRLTSCGVQVTPTVTPDSVLVTQGKTRLKGAKLIYDEKDGTARIDGPVSFNRAQDDGDPLDGSAKRIEISVDDEQTTLVGNVELKQGNRTSKAERVDYDDKANTAILHGTPEAPAETSTPTELLRAQTIRYDLNSGEAVVESESGKNSISGKFEDSDATSGDSTQGGSTGGTPTPGTSRPGAPGGS